jgi:hypothetical protein
MKRFQVDIKPNHQPFVRQLMKKLGNVSSADAIGFLIETQMSAALARLEPVLRVPQLATSSPRSATENLRSVTGCTTPQQDQPQDVARSHQLSTASHTTPQDDATNALDALLSA